MSNDAVLARRITQTHTDTAPTQTPTPAANHTHTRTHTHDTHTHTQPPPPPPPPHTNLSRLHSELGLTVTLGEFFGIANHLLNLLLTQTALGVANGDAFLLLRAEICCSHEQNAVGINIKGDVYLRHPAGCRRDRPQLEAS